MLNRAPIAAHAASGSVLAISSLVSRIVFVAGLVVIASTVRGGVVHTVGVIRPVTCKFNLTLGRPEPYEAPYTGMATGHIRYAAVTHSAARVSQKMLDTLLLNAY